MAKKETMKKEKTPKASLPQNILQMGEHVEQEKKIYITQSAYKQIQRFTRNKTKVESGGILVGKVIEELGQQHIMIEGFVEGKFSEGTATTLTFTHKTWDYVHKEQEKKFPGRKILGWIHTHPDFGVFLSDYDKFIHENFFNEENQVAYVVDPIRREEGFYFWINGNLERCKGFFIYEKTGITLDAKLAERKTPVYQDAGSSMLQRVLTGVLCAAVLVLGIHAVVMSNQIKKLENQIQKNKEDILTTQQSILSIVPEIGTLMQETVSELEKQIDFIWEHEGYPELPGETQTSETEE